MTAVRGAELTLGYRQLYMLPTRFGLMFTALLLVLLLASINYNNGLAYGLTFLLASMGIVSMLYTHRNLYRLTVHTGACAPVFAGQPAHFSAWLHNVRGPYRLGVTVEQDKQEVLRLDLADQTQEAFTLSAPTRQRGYVDSPVFRLSTTYPLGLLYSWSRYLQLDQRCLVYPRPQGDRPLPAALPLSQGDSHGASNEGDDFAGLREFRLGDAPQHVSWKAAARGLGLYTKEFKGSGPTQLWLDWETLPGLDEEQRLGQLTRWVLVAEEAGLHYGLRLPTVVLTPQHGSDHQHACLKALALYPQRP